MNPFTPIALAVALFVSLAAWWWADRVRFPGLLAALMLTVLGAGSTWAGAQLLLLWRAVPKAAGDAKDALLAQGLVDLELNLLTALVAAVLLLPPHLLALRRHPTADRRVAWGLAAALSAVGGLAIADILYRMARIVGMYRTVQAGTHPQPTAGQLSTGTLELSGAGMVGLGLGPTLVAVSVVVGLVLMARRNRDALDAETSR